MSILLVFLFTSIHNIPVPGRTLIVQTPSFNVVFSKLSASSLSDISSCCWVVRLTGELLLLCSENSPSEYHVIIDPARCLSHPEPYTQEIELKIL